MMKMLIMRMIYIQTGHKVKLYLLILLTLMSSCDLFRWDDGGDYKYKSYIRNESNSSIRILIDKENSPYSLDTILVHNEQVIYNSGREVDKGDDVLTERLFLDSYDDSYNVNIFIDDSLYIVWTGPTTYMGDSIHHFYNYDSWDIELIDNEYILEFTIYESDLKDD
jgi:hypothetical protein